MSAVTPRWSALYADAHAARLLELAPHARTRRAGGVTAVVMGTASNVDNGVVCESSTVARAVVAGLAFTTERDAPRRWFYLP